MALELGANSPRVSLVFWVLVEHPLCCGREGDGTRCSTPPSQPVDGNPRLGRTIRSYGFAATAAAATSVGGGLPRQRGASPTD